MLVHLAVSCMVCHVFLVNNMQSGMGVLPARFISDNSIRGNQDKMKVKEVYSYYCCFTYISHDVPDL